MSDVMRGTVSAAGLLAALLAMGSLPARAIEELEAEQSISDLLPNKFPSEERPQGIAARP